MSSAQDITLYMLPGTCALLPHILLNQAGLNFKYEGVPIDTLYSQDFSTKNPKHQVPVLVINDQTITENPAIAHAINQLAPEAKLFGETPVHFIRVCEWLNYFSAAIHAQAWGPYVRPGRFTTDTSAAALDNVSKASWQKLLDRFALIESKIPEDGWLLGTKEMTAADAYLLPFFQFMSFQERLGDDMAKQFPKYGKLVQRLQGLEPVKKTLDEIAEVRKTGLGVGPDR